MVNDKQQSNEMIITLETWEKIWCAQNSSYSKSKKNHKLKTWLILLRQKPVFIWIISIIQIIVFIGELGRNWALTGSPIEIKPSFNLGLGPSLFVLINMGARFSPCMHSIPGITDNKFYYFSCPNYTGSIEQSSCTLNELCGFTYSTPPNQWYRFMFPIFLHTGLIHIILNLLTQLIIGTRIERKNGTLRVVLIYFISGVFGIVLDTNFAPNGFVTVGCSGSLFGLVALYLLNILYDWHSSSSCYPLLNIMIDIVITFSLGFFPNISNFNHIGGFIMGLSLGVVLLAQPKRFRSIKWWIWSIIRCAYLLMIIVIYVVSFENIYSRKFQCSWCKYLDCLPIRNWCDIGYLKKINTTMTS
ncbi:hypothetical protein I4U23_023470 [Adineta vaga]|nr:hypothetical protein I4U23_023470 [Adineta vaga]